jgi:hypothetical protein
VASVHVPIVLALVADVAGLVGATTTVLALDLLIYAERCKERPLQSNKSCKLI